MAVALRVGEPLEHQHSHTLGPAGAVGAGGEGLAAPVGRQAALARELDEQRRAGHHGHTAGQRQRALPRRSAWHARCIATSEDEHAVSTVTAGPSRPKLYAKRPEATLADRAGARSTLELRWVRAERRRAGR